MKLQVNRTIFRLFSTASSAVNLACTALGELILPFLPQLSAHCDQLQFSSVTQSCPTLCDSRDCNTPGLPAPHNSRSLPKLLSIESMMQFNHLILCHPLLLPSIFPSIRVFSKESVLCIRWPSIGVLASAPVLPMNIQDWSPLGWTGWISLQSTGLWRVFSNTTVQKHQFFGAQLSL